jgi:predicted PilT family ATPase
MKRDNALPALVKANVENYRGAIALYLKQTEDNALVFIIGEAGAGKSYLAKLELPNALYPTPQQFAECDHISTMFTGFDVVIDDILRFDSDKVIECIQAVHASGHRVMVTGQPVDLELCTAYCRVYQWVTALCFRR